MLLFRGKEGGWDGLGKREKTLVREEREREGCFGFQLFFIPFLFFKMGKIFGVFYPFYKMVLYGFGFSLYVKVKKKLILNKYSLYHIKNKYMAHPILRIWTSGFV